MVHRIQFSQQEGKYIDPPKKSRRQRMECMDILKEIKYFCLSVLQC